MRRRRGKRRGRSLAGDAYELFLDAITNTMGVVMFIMLMVVLFARPQFTVDIPDTRAAADLRALRDQRDRLAMQVIALPPPGDPALVERWKAASNELRTLRREQDDLQRAILERLAVVAALRVEMQSAAERVDQLAQQLDRLKARQSQPTPSRVRLGRFHADTRPAVLLALSNGRLSMPTITRQSASLAPPVQGVDLPDAAAARAILQQAMARTPPATHRVELAVWQDSFAQAKWVEQVLLEMGYDTNPIPVEAGKPLGAGTGGVQ